MCHDRLLLVNINNNLVIKGYLTGETGIFNDLFITNNFYHNPNYFDAYNSLTGSITGTCVNVPFDSGTGTTPFMLMVLTPTLNANADEPIPLVAGT